MVRFLESSSPCLSRDTEPVTSPSSRNQLWRILRLNRYERELRRRQAKGESGKLNTADIRQLPAPRNLLFIQPDVPPSNRAMASTTPNDEDIGNRLDDPAERARFAETPTPKSTSPPILALPVIRPQGDIGHREAALPHVHSEPAEYYGGKEVWSRARTFSNVCHYLRIKLMAGGCDGLQQEETAADGRGDYL